MIGAVVHAVQSKPVPESSAAYEPLLPRYPSDEKVEQLAMVGCTDAEIADKFLLDEDEITLRYALALRRGRAIGAVALRKAQFVSAVNETSSSLLVWLGKNRLGQCNDPGKKGDGEFEMGIKDG